MGRGVGYIIRGPQTKSGQPPSTQLYDLQVRLLMGIFTHRAAGNSVLIGNPIHPL
jgi:hypothetical protein